MSIYNNIYDPITGTYINVPLNNIPIYQPNIIMSPLNPNFVFPINHMHPIQPLQPMQPYIMPYTMQPTAFNPFMPVNTLNPFNQFNF